MEWVDVLAIAVALGFAAIGVWQGFRRTIMVALAGVVLGVLMGTLWGDAWGQSVADRLGGSVDVTQGVIRLGSLLFIVLFVGFGSAIFMPRRRPLLWQRLLGGLVGLVNGLLVEAFSFQYIQEYFLSNDPNSLLETAVIPRLLTQWLPWVFLGIVLAISLTVIVLALIRFARYVTSLIQPAPAAVPVPQPVPTAPPTGPAVTEPAVEPIPITPAEPAEVGRTIPCPNCSWPVPEEAVYCPNCGKIVSASGAE